MNRTLAALFLLLNAGVSYSQSSSLLSIGGGVFSGSFNNEQTPCLTSEQYQLIDQTCLENARLLGLDQAASREAQSVSLQWPLRMASGVNDCGYYFISAYVDHDTTAGAYKDHNCGSNSYDGHQGTDIVPWPYPLYRMDHDEIEVIAAAPGTILNKSDGNFDRNCANNTLTPNYIVIRHADGTLAMYLHLKKNSLTSKTVGQTVSLGEFLGRVGSSGNSSGPHLHFEVRTNNANSSFQDPWSGSCNRRNSNSWWAVQKPYTEPAVVKTSVHSAPPVVPGCPEVETPNDTDCFQPGTIAYFAIFMRDETPGTTVNMSILNSAGTPVANWVHNCTSSYNGTWWWFQRNLPNNPGAYTFRATYNNLTCSSGFTINCSPSSLSDPSSAHLFRLFPNPTAGIVKLEADGAILPGTVFEISNMLGQPVYRSALTEYTSQIDLNLVPGCYLYRIIPTDGIAQTGKLLMQ